MVDTIKHLDIKNLSAYFIGMLHADLLMIQKDLRMGEVKDALAKLESAIHLIEDKVAEVVNGLEHDKTSNQ